jgi:two-component system, sensor histidine kinase PdtaS
MIVRDDGVGIPATWSLDDDAHLGLQIAGMLVQTELGGSLTVAPLEPHGTEARAELPLPATS